MSRAAEGSLKALGMERHQALIVSHRDGQPHVHVIANRVEPESGKAAGLSRSKLKLSKWAERYEREQGKIRCPATGEEQCEATGARENGFRIGSRAFDRAAGGGQEMSPQREPAGSDPGGRGTDGAARSGSGWPGSGQRSVRGLGAASEAAWQGARGTGETEQAGVGRRFTGVTSGSGSSWRKTAVGRNAADRSGTMAPAARSLSRASPTVVGSLSWGRGRILDARISI